MRDGTRLMLRALNRLSPNGPGRNAKAGAKDTAHVRFIVKPSFQRDFGNRTLGVLKLLLCMGDAQVGDVAPNRLPELAAERNCQGHWVNTGCCGDLRQPDRVRIVRVDQSRCV